MCIMKTFLFQFLYLVFFSCNLLGNFSDKKNTFELLLSLCHCGEDSRALEFLNFNLNLIIPKKR